MPAGFVAQLSGRRRLDRLAPPGDERSAVRSVFSWSYRHLSPEAAAAFALLGLHPGRRYERHALAALAGTGAGPAADALAELGRAHLLEPAGDGWTMHDLLREYAREQDVPAPAEALDRLLDGWLRAAAEAMDVLFPHEAALRPAVPDPGVPRPALAEPAAAADWLEQERPNLVAAALRSPRHAVGLSRVLWRHLEVTGRHQEALLLHTTAEAAARELGPEHADVLANLGGIRWWQGEYEAALDCYRRSLAAHREAGDAAGQARALARLGPVLERLGDYPAAVAHLEQALALHRAAGHRHGEGAQLVNLGTLHRRLGRYELAAEHQRQAAAIFAELGDRRLEGYALGNLGAVETLRGRPGEALPHLEAALAHCRAAADPGGEASALAELGVALLGLGRPEQARERLEAALAISRRTGDRAVQTEVLNRLGRTLDALGRPTEARQRYAAALELAERSGDRFEQAAAHDGLAAGDPEHRAEADRLRRELGLVDP